MAKQKLHNQLIMKLLFAFHEKSNYVGLKKIFVIT
jgi:hypothetical protein